MAMNYGLVTYILTTVTNFKNSVQMFGKLDVWCTRLRATTYVYRAQVDKQHFVKLMLLCVLK